MSAPASNGGRLTNWIDVRSAVEVALAFRERPTLLYSYGGRTEQGVLISPA